MDWLLEMNAARGKWMHNHADLTSEHPRRDKGGDPSASDHRLQQKRRALQWLLGEDPQHGGTLYA